MAGFRTMFVLALPFVIGAAAARSAVAPIGDALARQAGVVAGLLSGPAPRAGRAADRRTDDDEGSAEDGAELASSASRASSPSGRQKRERRAAIRALGNVTNEAAALAASSPARGPLAAGPAGTIVVPASLVERALQRKDVGASNATAADGTPLGARLRGVGKYRAGLRDGDVVVMVEGVATPNVEAMIMQAMRAASAGATRLSGRIRRGEATYDVVLELPSR